MPENSSPPAGAPISKPAAGERIAKLLSRRGVASRREAERLIEAGEVSVNGRIITSPALNVTGEERITVSGKLLPAEEQARLWLYYKPEGLVTSASDEKGRDTVFDHLPEDMPRVMSVGRLDLNSEGLLLLTNDGGLKRRLELPSTGWLRKYRVRVNGMADEVKIQTLRDGITVDGEHFKPMQVTIDRQQGANAWFTIGLREGKNREIRRAMNAIGLYVNRLIRVSYGPFRLGDLEPGQVEEVKTRVLRDQLGEIDAAASEERATGKPAATRRPGLTRVRVGRDQPERQTGGPARKPTGKPTESRTGTPRPGAARPASARPGTDRSDPTRSAAAKPASRSAPGGAKSAARGAASAFDARETGSRAPAERPKTATARTGTAKPRPPKPQSTRNTPPSAGPGKPRGPSGRGGSGQGGPGRKG